MSVFDLFSVRSLIPLTSLLTVGSHFGALGARLLRRHIFSTNTRDVGCLFWCVDGASSYLPVSKRHINNFLTKGRGN
ncbi:unnamed protein product [Ixodes pacificus]